MIFQSDVLSFDPVSLDHNILHVGLSNRFASSESIQTDIPFLAPPVELFSRTAIPHLFLHHGYLFEPIIIVDLVGQGMLDPSVCICELWKQIALDPVTEGFQVV
jgi:hypothetical protein